VESYTIMERDPTPDSLPLIERGDHEVSRMVTLELDAFAWETLAEQSAALGVDVEELVTFAALYYIADIDSKRIARCLPTGMHSPSNPRGR
jgi:hypothetical protein